VAPHINGRLNWERAGKHGRPLVLVHPNPMDHTCWVYQMAHLQTWFRCVAIDLPGYGRSPSASPGLTMPDVAQACWEAVDEVTDEPAILAGVSVGSNVVLHMAHQQPERTLAILLTGWGYYAVKDFAFTRIRQYSEQGIAFRREHALMDFKVAFRETEMGQYFADMFEERNGHTDAGTIIEMFRALSDPDPEWLYSGVKAPTLFITGSEDVAHQGAFEAQRRIPGCELVTMEAAGHACNMERPWEWDRHALEFLRRHGLVEAG
jgi:pimeloyl-ACP methyl ester carboxylesterase